MIDRMGRDKYMYELAAIWGLPIDEFKKRAKKLREKELRELKKAERVLAMPDDRLIYEVAKILARIDLSREQQMKLVRKAIEKDKERPKM